MSATRLSFMPARSPPSTKGKQVFTSAWIEMQHQHLQLEHEKTIREISVQKQQAKAIEAKEQKEHQLTIQIAKANFVAELNSPNFDPPQ